MGERRELGQQDGDRMQLDRQPRRHASIVPDSGPLAGPMIDDAASHA
jgi:hypothetical protein